MKNGLVQLIRIGKSIRQMWVKAVVLMLILFGKVLWYFTMMRFMVSLALLFVLMGFSPVYNCDHLALGRESGSLCFSCI